MQYSVGMHGVQFGGGFEDNVVVLCDREKIMSLVQEHFTNLEE